jgi:L-fucose isomerase
MRNTAVGLVLVNDERPHVWRENSQENMAVVEKWAAKIKARLEREGNCPPLVVASETITDVRTAQKVGAELLRAGVKQLIMCYNVWNFPYLAWPLVNSFGRDLPILSLSGNNGKYPGNVGLLATDGALRQAGRRTHRIIGEYDDPDTVEQVAAWVRASQAVTTIRNEVFGLYGGHAMGMETGFFHLVPLQKALGCTAYQLDQLLVVKVMEGISQREVERGREWFESLLGDRLLYDGRMLTERTLENQIRLYLAVKKLNEDYGLDFCGIKGQRELTEFVCLGDVAEMLLNDPYDWNGPKEPTVCATEADAGAAVTMQLLKYLSGGLPTLFMDVRLYHPELEMWDMCNSGNHSSFYAALSPEPAENFSRITFHPALEYYFKAGGASVQFDAAPGRLTFARLGLYDDKPFMVLASAQSLDLPADQRRALGQETDPTWPHVYARLDGSFSEFLQYFPANHVQAVAGDRIASLVYACELAGIKPIVLGKRGKDYRPPIWELMK